MARGSPPRLLHVRPGDGGLPDVPDEPLDTVHVQSGLRNARRDDPAGRFLPGAQLGRPPSRRNRGRRVHAAARQPVGPARVARAQASSRLGLLLGDLAGHQGHDQRVSVLEPGLRGPARSCSGDSDLSPLRGGGPQPGPPPRRARRNLGPAALGSGAARLRRCVSGAHQRLGRSAARGTSPAGHPGRDGSHAGALAREPRTGGCGAHGRRGVRRPLRPAVLVPGRRPARPRQEPRAFLARRRSAHRLRSLHLPRDRVVDVLGRQPTRGSRRGPGLALGRGAAPGGGARRFSRGGSRTCSCSRASCSSSRRSSFSPRRRKIA